METKLVRIHDLIVGDIVIAYNTQIKIIERKYNMFEGSLFIHGKGKDGNNLYHEISFKENFTYNKLL